MARNTNDIAYSLIEGLKALASQIEKADDKDLMNWVESYPRSATSALELVERLTLIVAKAA